MKELTLLCWYLFDNYKYNAYKQLIERAFYSKEDAFERIKNTWGNGR